MSEFQSEVTSITSKYTSRYALYLFNRFGTGSSEQACLKFYHASDPHRRIKIVTTFSEIFSKYKEGGQFDTKQTRKDFKDYLEKELDFLPDLQDTAMKYAMQLIKKSED
tara:strand:- start:1560 stop:1886 length:327 start_codon:yes stop_codon:yes gene_type:complete